MSKANKTNVEVIELGADELSDFASLSMCSVEVRASGLSKLLKAILPRNKK
jgi:hypothetical protein